jgi:hypothetical protein
MGEIKENEESSDTKIIPYYDSKLLVEFLEQPKIKIIEALTGAFSLGKGDAIMMGGRILQAVFKGNAYQQLAREIKLLIDKGKIKEDYVETKFGFKSLTEMLEFIDKEMPDEDRLTAVRAIFYSIVSKSSVLPGQEILKYQLFQIVKKLTTSQLLILGISYQLYKDGPKPKTIAYGFGHDRTSWLRIISERIGHKLPSLIKNDEEVLVNYNLIGDVISSDSGGMRYLNARLTDLGIELCKNLEEYNPEKLKE